ncbi:GMC oxidoreductase [Saccharopolyspora sp. NPDC050389]|uniref:GMC family oxidoreductase n=1 Tax=Saccharopolyspora sp. NPDC050389 TaxID=3155516 RepID=UPI0033D93BB6
MTASDWRRFIWAPKLGLHGIMRNVLFRHVFSSTQTGVGGGSLVYGGVLFRAQDGFYRDPQWSGIAEWDSVLAPPHYATAEQMLGVQATPWESVTMRLTKELAGHFGTEETFASAPVGVFFGEPGETVEDPYFGGEGPPRTGCTRCGACMVGCRTGAANRLTKNYLWFAEKYGAQIFAEREVLDVSPIGASDGRDGYRVVTASTASRRSRDRRTFTTRGVVFAGGAVGTNELLATCKHQGSLPRISDRLGSLVRTNSEAVLSVLLPDDLGTWRDVTASSRVMLDQDTQVEFLTYGRHGDFMRLMFTALASGGSHPRRLAKWLGGVLRHPRQWIATMRSGWSSRTTMMLVMQARDNAIASVPRKLFGSGYRLATETDSARPAPTYIDVGHRAVKWMAERTGGIPQSSIFEAIGGRPMTAHVLGGAAIGANPARGVVDERLRVFGYENLIVCDAAALPANPGVNPALTITALAEHAMVNIPPSAKGD